MASGPQDQVSRSAARMGRVVIFIVGAVFTAVSAAYGYSVPSSNQLLVGVAFGIGLILIITAFAASDRFCANFGLQLPWFLP